MKVISDSITLGSKSYNAVELDYESVSSESGSIDVGSKTYTAIKKYGINTEYDVTNTLSHCKTTNEQTTISKSLRYFAKIIPDEGYTLTGATVSVKMGGTNITTTAYDDGEIIITTVTGDIEITITAKQN